MIKLLKRNHKGAALVSIMVAVAFISIIATTLLMISINNYEMKVESNNSKRNFYETEQDLNIVTAKVRSEIKASTGNPTTDVLKLVGGSETATAYTGDRIAKLVYPGAGSATVVDGGDTFTFGGGNIVVENKTGGDKVTLKGVSVKQTNSAGFENTIKTDIEFFIKKPVSGDCNAGVGDCSFLLDNTFKVETSTDSTRVNIYGCSIIGKYELKTDHSEPYHIAVNEGSISTSKSDNVSKSSLALGGYGGLNFLSDYTVILGDVYLYDQSLLIINKGNFTVFGNIYVTDKAALICKGNLKLGKDCGIYAVDSTGNIGSKITSTVKDKNIILNGELKELGQSDYDGIAEKMKLNNSSADDDGVLPNILKENDGYYCYDFIHDDFACDDIYFDGHKYQIKIPESNFNGDHSYSMLFVPKNQTSELTENAANCTIIGKDPVKVTGTHGINLSQVGPEVFNYFLNNEHEMKAKNSTTYTVNTYNVQGFFDANCNSTVQSIFNSSLGGGGSITGSSENGAIFTNWQRE